jgi:hypothetical protein
MEITFQRCSFHWQREAVAKCPECNRFFCRECITEHEGRVVCADCLKKLVHREERKSRNPLRYVSQVLKFAFGVVVIWIFFYYLGRILMVIPESFHDGTIWK